MKGGFENMNWWEVKKQEGAKRNYYAFKEIFLLFIQNYSSYGITSLQIVGWGFSNSPKVIDQIREIRSSKILNNDIDYC